MRFAGIDPSLTALGVVVIDGDRVKRYKLVRTSKTDNEYDTQLRVEEVVQQAIRALAGVPRRNVGVENNAFGVQHGDTRLVELAGVLKQELWRRGFLFRLYASNSVKKLATGNGRATKQDMMDAAREVGFEPGAEDHNLADAYFVARARQLEHGVR